MNSMKISGISDQTNILFVTAIISLLIKLKLYLFELSRPSNGLRVSLRFRRLSFVSVSVILARVSSQICQGNCI